MKSDSSPYAPIEVFCPTCGFRRQVTAADRAWPNCPNCLDPFQRYDGNQREGQSRMSVGKPAVLNTGYREEWTIKPIESEPIIQWNTEPIIWDEGIPVPIYHSIDHYMDSLPPMNAGRDAIGDRVAEAVQQKAAEAIRNDGWKWIDSEEQ